ncbi:MAG: IS66 family transposase [Erysipelotrichaceae bacterium]|nr:IS66 family transposase [Erysipelotrichaceae bacterium]
MADLEKAKHLSKNALYTLVCDQQEIITKQDIQINELGNEITALKTQMNAVYEQLNWFKELQNLYNRQQYGSKSEVTVIPDQLTLSDLDSTIEAIQPKKDKEVETETVTYQRKVKKNTGKDIRDLPTTTVVHDLEDKTCPVCGGELRKVSENITHRELIHHKERFEVVVHVQPVYTCDKCYATWKKEARAYEPAPFFKAEVPEAIIPKSFASPSILSEIINNKFNKALPLYRQEMAYEQLGIKLSRQTMAKWLIKLYDMYFMKIQEHMHRKLLGCEYIEVDETTIQVLHVPDKSPTSKTYMWVYVTGRSEDEQFVIYKYEPGRNYEYAIDYLEGFKGILETDGYGAYDNVEGVSIYAGCWAHTRRKFHEAYEALGSGADKTSTASFKLEGIINKLFKIEDEMNKAGYDYDKILEIRKEKSSKIVDEFFEEVQKVNDQAVKGTHLYKALQYSMNQETKLRKFLEDGRIELSTNRVENKVRPFTIGRKNYLFFNTVNGAEAGGAIYSIVESAKMNKLLTYDYMEYLLEQLTVINIDDEAQLEAIMPWSKFLPKELYI